MNSLSAKLGIILVAIGLFIFGNSEIFSFNIDRFKFKSGMTKKEVKEILEKTYWEGYSIKETPERISVQSIHQPANFMTFHFHNNKLFSYIKYDVMEPSIRNFIMLFNQFTGLYGKSFDSDSKILIDAYGEKREICFFWRIEASGIVRLRYYVFPGNDQLDVMYSTTEGR